MPPTAISLAVVPTPILDESPASWLMRLCQLHEIWPLKLFNILRMGKMNDFDRQLEIKHLSVLTHGAGVRMERLVCLASKFQNVRAEKLCMAFLLGPDQQAAHYRFCPECLAADEIPYWRFTWRMSYYKFCPMHRSELHGRCNNCNQRVAPIARMSAAFGSSNPFVCFCHACGNDLRQCDQKNVGDLEALEHALDLQRIITAAVIRGHYAVKGVEGPFPLSTLPRTLSLGGYPYKEKEMDLPIPANESWKLGRVNPLMIRALRQLLLKKSDEAARDSATSY